MQNNPLYMRIYKDISTKITNKQYKSGEFLPPERILSEKYSVQRPTIRKALDLLAQNNYILKIQGSGNKVIYSNKKKEPAPNVIVYVMPNFSEQQPYHMEICSCLEKLCSEKNYSILFTKSRIIDNELPQWFYSPNVIGAIFVSGIDASLLEAAKQADLPSIIFCSEYEHFPKINLDDVGAGRIATSHLIECGCKNIAHISGPDNNLNAIRRKEGYKISLLTNNMDINDNYTTEGDWSYNSGYKNADFLLTKYPDIDGIYAANDLMALGAINVAYKKGYRVPEDIKIIGIDNINDCEKSIVPLSTVSFSKEDIALMLFYMINNIFNNEKIPEEIIIPPKLIVRKSTK